MSSNNAFPGALEGDTMTSVYKWRVFWYVGALLVAFGALRLPGSPFVAGMLVPGILRYMMQTIPIAIVAILVFALLNGHVPEKTLGIRFRTISRLTIAAGVVLVVWGFAQSSHVWGAVGITTICWGGELGLLPRESAYWEARREARRGRR